jgi:hypothetical protein
MAITCSHVRDLAPGFVLGALDRAEMAAVREHLETCPRPHPEFRDLGGVVSYIGDSLVPIEPPEGLKAAVVAAARADLKARRAAPRTAGAPILTVVSSRPEAAVVRHRTLDRLRSRRAASWLIRAAAALAIVVLAGSVFTLQGELNRAKASPDPVYDIANGARSTTLTPVGNASGGGLAALLPSGNLHVYLSGLEPTAGDEVYVVWVSTDGGTSRSAGWFTVDDSGRGYAELNDLSVSTSVWVYVCREPNRDVTRPTGPVVVGGTIYMWSVPSSTPAF